MYTFSRRMEDRGSTESAIRRPGPAGRWDFIDGNRSRAFARLRPFKGRPSRPFMGEGNLVPGQSRLQPFLRACFHNDCRTFPSISPKGTVGRIAQTSRGAWHAAQPFPGSSFFRLPWVAAVAATLGWGYVSRFAGTLHASGRFSSILQFVVHGERARFSGKRGFPSSRAAAKALCLFWLFVSSYDRCRPLRLMERYNPACRSTRQPGCAHSRSVFEFSTESTWAFQRTC